jgi:hypothetical protein
MKIKLMSISLVIAICLMSTAFADNVDTSLTITNANPTVGSVTATDPVTLSEGTAVTVWCNATATDTNGYADITGVAAKLWGPTGLEGDADNFNTHYTNSSCVLSGGSGTTVDAVCKFSVRYSAESGEWTCKLTATDASAGTGSASNTAVTINSLVALAVPSSLGFTATALGGTTPEATVAVNNTGNSQIDVQLYTYGSADDDGYTMVCTLGGSEIAYTALKYNLTTGQAYGNMSTIGRNSTSPLTDTAFNLAKDSNATVSSKDVYWKLQVPSSDIGGSCTGKLVVVATSG